MSRIDFNRFNNGTLFLIRTPETFPEGYAQSAFEDMKRLHLDYAAHLETWNCQDGILWKHPDYPRSSYWQHCDRDPMEETFLAADAAGIAFLPECGVMHAAYAESNHEGMMHFPDGSRYFYGRIGLVPSAPMTADYFIAKYDAFIEKFKGHPSFRGICMPAENGIRLSYDRYTAKAWQEHSGRALPTPADLADNETLMKEIYAFLEAEFLRMYRKLARHLKQKYDLPLMHYPVSKVSAVSHFEPNIYYPAHNLDVMTQVEEIDLLNLQLHPPLGDHPRQFKMEIELLGSLTDKPFVADTHWYHECNGGKLPELNPKRYVDWVLSTLTPYGISFFSYGFMAEKLPLWKDELNPGAKVFNCYSDDDAVALRRKSALKSMDFVQKLCPLMENMKREAECAIFYRESFDDDYRYGSYYREHLFSLYEALQATARPVIFTPEIPENTDKIKCLIFDAVKSFSAVDSANLARYLASGGKAIIVGKCAETLYRTCDLPIESCEGDYIVRPGSDGKWYFGIPCDAVKFTAAGDETLYAYNNGIPAVIRKGNVIFVGCSAAVSDFDNLRQRGIVEMWQKLLELCDAGSAVQLRADYLQRPGFHEFVSTDLYRAKDGSRLLLLIRDFGVEVTAAELKWSLPEDFIVDRVILDGKDIDMPENGVFPEFEYFIAIQARHK